MSISASEAAKRYRSVADGPSRGGRSPVLDLERLRLADPSRGILVVLRCVSISGFVLNDCADSPCWLSCIVNWINNRYSWFVKILAWISTATGLSQLFLLHLRIVLDVVVGDLVEVVLAELLLDYVVERIGFEHQLGVLHRPHFDTRHDVCSALRLIANHVVESGKDSLGV